MILMLDTSTPVCRLTFIDLDFRYDDEWQANRDLARGLLGYLNKTLQKCNKNWSDITALGVFEGPGSFTGLRIGITVMNTIADARSIPIVGGRGELWQDEVLNRLKAGSGNSSIVLPFYGSEANITISKK
jgi:tRNA threonylcarbamoyladenosine biosynthesis protein TsaB